MSPPFNQNNPRNRILYGSIIALGMGISILTLLLVVTPFDCVGGRCGEILQSTYGKIFGIPVGFLSLILWITLMANQRTLARLSKILLILGSIYFVGIQTLVIKQFCPYCAIHALLCFSLSLFSINLKANRMFGFAGIVLSLGIFVLMAKAQSSFTIPAQAEEQMVIETKNPNLETNHPPTSGNPTIQGTEYITDVLLSNQLPLPWVSPNVYHQRALIVNLFCNACIYHLGHLQKLDRNAHEIAPLIWKTSDQSRPATTLLIAAVISRNDLKVQESFSIAFSKLTATRAWFQKSDTSILRKLLISDFPDLDLFIPEAEAIVANHSDFIEKHNIDVTPTLFIDGSIYRRFAFEETFRANP